MSAADAMRIKKNKQSRLNDEQAEKFVLFTITFSLPDWIRNIQYHILETTRTQMSAEQPILI